jgi:hypothetical protein
MSNEADTFRKYVLPRLIKAGWDSDPHSLAILDELFEKYADHGPAQFTVPDILQVPPISKHGNVMEIAGLFGGP